VGREDLRKLEDLFWQGASVDPAQRDAWLQSVTTDGALREVLASMLATDGDDTDITGQLGAAFSAATVKIAVGERLGPYRILRELGRGGTGVVYLADRADDQFDLQVAIKLIGGVATPDAARQLRHERQLLATLDHPNIARLLDGGETADGHPYLVMEYVRGSPISAACEKRQLSVTERVRLMVEIAQAVNYAHQRLVVHRDIKPGNVLLREDGRPVLLDFGVAKLLHAEGPNPVTQPWLTPAYASPEQLRCEPVSTGSDIFALGILLFELLAGRLPPRGQNEIPRPSELAPAARRATIKGDLDAIVRRACAQDVRDRYATAQAMSEDLERWLAGFPVHAARRGWGYAAWKLIRRRPIESVMFVALLVALGVGAVRLAEQRDRATRFARDAETVTAFLTDLFRQAEPGSSGPRLLTAVDLVAFGEQRLQDREDLPPHLRARLAGTLGEIYRSLGQPKKATELLIAAVDAAHESGATPAERAQYLRLLGSALDHRGRYAEAQQRYEEVLALLSPYDDAGQNATDLSKLGLMQSRQRMFDEAGATLRRARVLAHSSLGTQHPTTNEIELYLAEMLALEDRPQEALGLIDAPIARMRTALGPRDPALLAAMTIQATVLREAGNFLAAERVLLEVLRHRRFILAEDSWLISSVHDSLGHVYYEQGRTLEAGKQFQESLELSRRSLAADDPALASNLNNVAELYEEQGDYVRGLPPMREALALAERNASDQELPLFRYRQNLGRMLLLSGEAAESRTLLELPIPEKDDPRYVLQRARQRLHLAEWHRRFGDPATATQLLDAIDASVAEIGGENSPRYAFALRVRAALAAKAGDFEAARALLERALATAIAARGERYVGVGLVLLELSELAIAEKDFATARRWHERADAVLDPVLVREAPQRARLEVVGKRLRESR
jgi:tetratricopeptide (TPR) repeat protein/predicted Ser/Thr protein kinase